MFCFVEKFFNTYRFLPLERSNCLVLAELFSTFATIVLLIVAVGNAKGNEAAPKPTANYANEQAGDPSDETRLSLNASLCCLTTMVALDNF